MAQRITTEAMVTIGLDLGDRQTAGCVVDEGGQIFERFEARTPPTRLLAAGYVVVVANARRVRLIAENDAKSDRLDAELLRQVPGVGPLTALTYVLTLKDPTRFPRSRTVGAACAWPGEGKGRQETGGRGGRPQAGGATASAVADRRGLRTRGRSDAGGPRRLTGGERATRRDDGRTADQGDRVRVTAIQALVVRDRLAESSTRPRSDLNVHRARQSTESADGSRGP